MIRIIMHSSKMSLLLHQTVTVFLCLLQTGYCRQELTNVFFNFKADCQRNTPFSVSTSTGYILTMPIAGDKSINSTNFIGNCEIRFESPTDDDRICISQESILGVIKDTNSEIIARDGDDDRGTEIFTLEAFPNEWSKREACTSSKKLFMTLRKKNQNAEVDVTQIFIMFKVLDIKSEHRIIYLDREYNDGTYPLKYSWLMIKERLPSHFIPEDEVLRQKKFADIKLSRSSNDTIICMMYVPLTSTCTVEWQLGFSKENSVTFGKDDFTMKCSEGRQTKSWCGKSTVDQYSIILNRNKIAEDFGTSRFFIIATDKAANQHSIEKMYSEWNERQKATESPKTTKKEGSSVTQDPGGKYENEINSGSCHRAYVGCIAFGLLVYFL